MKGSRAALEPLSDSSGSPCLSGAVDRHRHGHIEPGVQLRPDTIAEHLDIPLLPFAKR